MGIRSLNNGVVPQILHFWSLDCEGCEGIALETFDWDKTEVAVLHVELKPGTGSSCGGDVSKCEGILRAHGMERWTIFGADQVWYSPKYFERSNQLLPVPADDDMVTPWLDIADSLRDFGFNVAETQHSYCENTRKKLDEVHERI